MLQDHLAGRRSEIDAINGMVEPLAHEVNEIALAGLNKDERKTLHKALATMNRNLEADERRAAQSGIRVPPTKGNMTT